MADTFFDYRGLARDLMHHGQPDLPPPDVLRMGQVVGYDPNWKVDPNTGVGDHHHPLVSVLLAGDESVMHGFRCSDHYTPNIGDTVWAMVSGSDLWVLGSLHGNNKYIHGRTGGMSNALAHKDWDLTLNSGNGYVAGKGWKWPYSGNNPYTVWSPSRVSDSPIGGGGGIGEVTTAILPNRTYRIDVVVSISLSPSANTNPGLLSVGIATPFNDENHGGHLMQLAGINPGIAAAATAIPGITGYSEINSDLVWYAPWSTATNLAAGVQKALHRHTLSGHTTWSCVPTMSMSPSDADYWPHLWPQSYTWPLILSFAWSDPAPPTAMFVRQISMTVHDEGITHAGSSIPKSPPSGNSAGDTIPNSASVETGPFRVGVVGTPLGTTKGNAAVAAAATQLGLPYLWGGETPGVGFDCSGLVQWAWKQAGVVIPRTTETQWAALQHVPLNQLQPGDLLFYYNLDGDHQVDHVVMYVGHGAYGKSTTIAAARTGTTISYEAMYTGGLIGVGRP